MKKLTNKFPKIIREMPRTKRNTDRDIDIITSDCLHLFFEESYSKEKRKKYVKK